MTDTEENTRDDGFECENKKFLFRYVSKGAFIRLLGVSWPMRGEELTAEQLKTVLRAPGRPACEDLPVEVHRRCGADTNYVPWVVVDHSRALAGARDPGLGVFAARNFAQHARLGRYTGRIVAPPQTPPADLDAIAGDDTYQLTMNYGVVRANLPPQSVREQMAVLKIANAIDAPFPDREWRACQLAGDPENVWPDMYAHLINDPRGVAGAAANVDVDADGFVYALGYIRAGEELLFSYGDEYWNAAEQRRGKRVKRMSSRGLC